MTFLAPWALWVAGGVSAAVVALHLLASATPRTMLLPTTRFIPDRAASATARAIRFSDLLLMILRVAVVMLVGLAFARPMLAGSRRPVGRVVMVDRSRAANPAEANDSVAAYYRDGDRLFFFDSASSESSGKDASLRSADEKDLAVQTQGSLSVGLAAAMRAASALRGDADSVELVLISPVVREELDAATSAIRAAWPGRIRLVRLPVSRDTAPAQSPHALLRAPLDDPLRASLAFSARVATANAKGDSVRIDRGNPASADTAAAQRGITLVRWPSALDSSGYPRRARADTAGAVMAERVDGPAVVVAPFVRSVNPPPGRVIARWADGEPAATEHQVMNGCVRDVAIALPRAGDLVLRESTRRLVDALARPCGRGGDLTPASDSAVAALRGSGPLVATRTLAARTAPPGSLTAILLLTALALLLAEPLLRRPKATA
jgi:hypothetical protein